MFSTSPSFSSTDVVCETCRVGFAGSDTLGPLLEDLGLYMEDGHKAT